MNHFEQHGGFVQCLYAVTLGTIAMVVAGCGDGMAQVEGTVLLDGKAVIRTGVVRCGVTFEPVGGGPIATGTVNQEGRFKLAVGSSQSIPVGEYAASILVREVTPSDQPGGRASSRIISDKEYANSKTSGLKYTIESGGNTVEIAMQSRK